MRRLWKKIRLRLEVLAMRLFVALVPTLSRHAILRLANFAGDLVYAFDRRGRSVALANLAAAFGDRYLPAERERIARMSFRNLARTFLDLFWASNLTTENFRQLIEVHGWEEFCALRRSDQGCMLYSAHFGNFEWLPLTLGLLFERPVVIAQDIKNPEITPFFLRARSTLGTEPIPQQRAALRMLKALKRGRNCGLLIDLTLKLDQPGVLIDTFGLKKWVTSLHASLAARAGARLVAIIVLAKEDGRYEFHFSPQRVGDSALSEQEITQQCWDPLEERIRENPAGWLWNYKHWRYLPAGAKNYPFYAQPGAKFEKILPGAPP